MACRGEVCIVGHPHYLLTEGCLWPESLVCAEQIDKANL